jgi:predicted nuclease with TOPRIM domain
MCQNNSKKMTSEYVEELENKIKKLEQENEMLRENFKQVLVGRLQMVHRYEKEISDILEGRK